MQVLSSELAAGGLYSFSFFSPDRNRQPMLFEALFESPDCRQRRAFEAGPGFIVGDEIDVEFEIARLKEPGQTDGMLVQIIDLGK